MFVASKTLARLSGLAIVLAAFAVGCTTPLERHWGASHRAHTEAMVQNPNASDQHEGLDPVTGQAVMDRYEKRAQKAERETRNQLFLFAQ